MGHRGGVISKTPEQKLCFMFGMSIDYLNFKKRLLEQIDEYKTATCTNFYSGSFGQLCCHALLLSV